MSPVKLLSSAVLILVGSMSLNLHSAELAGVTVKDSVIASSGETLVLNGMGLREKLWIDVYVGSLYLPEKANNVVKVLSQPGPLRIQMNIIYTEIDSEKLIKGWKDGFEKNQSKQKLSDLKDRIQQFYSYFEQNAVKGDVYTIDYVVGEGSGVSKNGDLLGVIPGEDFKNALVEIWLGNSPADTNLKKGMLGID